MPLSEGQIPKGSIMKLTIFKSIAFVFLIFTVVLGGCASQKTSGSHNTTLSDEFSGVWANTNSQYSNWWVITPKSILNYGIYPNGICSGTYAEILDKNKIKVDFGTQAQLELQLFNGFLIFKTNDDFAAHKKIKKSNICKKDNDEYYKNAPYQDSFESKLPFVVNKESIVFKLLEVNGAKAFFEQSKGQMAKVMYMTDPTLKSYSNLVEKWELQYFKWDKVKGSLAPIYAEKFSEQELHEIIAFYNDGKNEHFFNTFTGNKFKSLLPEINQEFTLSGHKYMTKVKPFLYEMIEKSNKAIKSNS